MMERYLKQSISWLFHRINYQACRDTKNGGPESCFTFVPAHKARPALTGFYMLEVSGSETLSQKYHVAVVDEVGSNEDGDAKSHESFFLLKPGPLNKRIFWFDKPVTHLKLVLPEGNDAPLDGLTYQFVKISSAFAHSRMIKKLTTAGEHPQILSSVEMPLLYEKYEQVFEIREQRGCSYSQWIETVEPGLWEPVITDSRSREPVRFSIVVPTYNSNPGFLFECVESVLKQTYPHWQLILVDDASTEDETFRSLRTIGDLDRRIKVVKQQKNGHICKTTNIGIQKAKGNFVVFLDHDDMLSEHALNEMAAAIDRHPQAKLFYSDEDLVSEKGERLHAHFKPDWNPELLSAHNYITHVTCYCRSLLDELKGLTIGKEGAQDYDLALRASKLLNDEQIIHIPKILYHWRMHEDSTAMDASAKNYATEAGLQSLTGFVQSKNELAKVEHAELDNFYKVIWPLPDFLPKASIIIPTRNGLDVLKPCVESVVETIDYDNYEIIIVDNGSDDRDTLNYLKDIDKDERIKVIPYNIPFNYSAINNFAVNQSEGSVLLFLNNDIEVKQPGWFKEMLSLACRPEIGCVGAKLYYPDGTIQHAGVILGLGGYAAHSHRGIDGNSAGYINRLNVRQNLSAVTGACLMMRKEVFLTVGGMDEEFAVAYNDVDLCLRVKDAGFKNVFTPYAELIHYESKTRGDEASEEEQQRFDAEKERLYQRWQKWIDHDPAYNPNLTRAREDFSI